MSRAPCRDGTGPGGDRLRPTYVAACVVGVVAVTSVVLTHVVPALLLRALVRTTSDPTSGTAAAAVTTVNELAWTVGLYVLPLLATGFVVYLVSGRGLPATHVAAGGFLGALLAPIGFVLGDVYLRPLETTLLSVEAFYTFATLTVGFVLPVVIGAALAAGLQTVRERRLRTFGLGS